MKRYIYMWIPLFAFILSACEDDMKEQVTLNVKAITQENTQQAGDNIIVKKGSPLTFALTGQPDFITFYSGEAGHQYAYKDRDQVAFDDIASSKLTFSVWYQYGNAASSADLMRFYIS